MEEQRPLCPICNTPMGKAGLAASGLSKVQRYRCNHCGKTTVKLSTETSSNNHHHNRHIIDFTDLEEAQIQVRSIKASMTIEQYLKTLVFREH